LDWFLIPDFGPIGTGTLVSVSGALGTGRGRGCCGSRLYPSRRRRGFAPV